MNALNPETTVTKRALINRVKGRTAFYSISPFSLNKEYEIYLPEILMFFVS